MGSWQGNWKKKSYIKHEWVSGLVSECSYLSLLSICLPFFWIAQENLLTFPVCCDTISTSYTGSSRLIWVYLILCSSLMISVWSILLYVFTYVSLSNFMCALYLYTRLSGFIILALICLIIGEKDMLMYRCCCCYYYYCRYCSCCCLKLDNCF